MENEEKAEEKYYQNGKIYNITASTKLYECIERELADITFMKSYRMTREVRRRVYKSLKGNLYETIVKDGRIGITDIDHQYFIDLLLRKNELRLIKELYPERYEELEEN